MTWMLKQWMSAVCGVALILGLATYSPAQATDDFDVQVYFSAEYHPKNIKWFTHPWEASEIRYRLRRQDNLKLTRPGESPATKIEIDPGKTFQTVTGIGASLDEASCYAIQKNHTDAQIKDILRQLIDLKDGIGLNLFRVCFGTSDFSDGRRVSSNPKGWYSYQDDPNGPFSIENDTKLGIIRVLKLAQQVAAESGQPIRFFGSAWSPPGWMKDSNNMVGGKLLATMYGQYAAYLRMAVQAYEAQGIPIYAVTTNNEHYFSPPAYPGCFFDAAAEAMLVEEMGKQFRDNHLDTKIWILDHNFAIWKRARETLDLLSKTTPNAEGYAFADAVAFHHYGGSPVAMTRLHDLFPDKNIEFSEGSVWGTAGIAEVAEIFRNWSKSYVYWVPVVTEKTNESIQGPYNVPGALSPTLFVTKDGGGQDMYRTPEYYLLGQFSRFVRPGAVRIESTATEKAGLTNVAFKNPDGTIVVVVVNQNEWKIDFKLVCGRNQVSAAIPACTVATLVFNSTAGTAPSRPSRRQRSAARSRPRMGTASSPSSGGPA